MGIAHVEQFRSEKVPEIHYHCVCPFNPKHKGRKLVHGCAHAPNCDLFRLVSSPPRAWEQRCRIPSRFRATAIHLHVSVDDFLRPALALPPLWFGSRAGSHARVTVSRTKRPSGSLVTIADPERNVQACDEMAQLIQSRFHSQNLMVGSSSRVPTKSQPARKRRSTT